MLYGFQSGSVGCGCGFAGAIPFEFGSRGFVHAMRASRISAQVVTRYFIGLSFTKFSDAIDG